MTLTLAIPFFNSLNDVKGIMGLLKHVTSPSVEWLIVDNGSSDPVEDFFYHTLKPKKLNFIKNPNNLGMVATYNQIFAETKTDLVAVLHNDVFIYEPKWDQRVAQCFETIDHLGCLGFFGAAGCGPKGERIQDPDYPGQMAGVSNLLEGEAHGIKLTAHEVRPVAILDGFAMVFNQKMIEKIGGLDTRYHYHHLYDRDLPLTALSHGYKNVCLGLACHHQSGVTANRPEYQAWIDKQLGKQSGGDIWTHDENSRIFAQKWAGKLPVYVEPDFTFRLGRRGPWDFQGDRILRS
jgi:GT2 family glycosyltransferase